MSLADRVKASLTKRMAAGQSAQAQAHTFHHAVLFDGSFDSVYQLPDDLAKVTPAQVRAFAAKYLVSTNRTIINRVPASGSEKHSGGGQ